MARKAKGVNAAIPHTISGNNSRISTDISEAENGFVVNVSGESGGKNPSYFSKRFIATNRPAAMKIAASHFSTTMKGTGGKKSGRKLGTKLL